MKRNLLTALVMSLVSATPALAASAREDSSGLVVWIFLGFCALIVVAQLIPAVLMGLGLIKGFAERGNEIEGEMSEQKARH